MRYYVYQLFEKPKPEMKWMDLISFDFHNPPVPYAVSLTPVADRSQVLNRLRRWLKLYGFGDLRKGQMLLQAGAKKKYFKHRFASFRDALLDLSAIGLDQFITEADNVSRNLFKLRDSFLSTSDCHFLLEDGSFVAMDQFMRQADESKPYYIGGVFEFHHVNPEWL